ncbi:hypothetical protein HZA45_00710 [Candidatus Peregrinibacteria bacterium]|nr:hypothetical protein [Candidatus Peregrinibacteria bacterium]
MTHPEVKEALTAHENVDHRTEISLALLAGNIQKEHPEKKLPEEYAQLLRGQSGMT